MAVEHNFDDVDEFTRNLPDEWSDPFPPNWDILEFEFIGVSLDSLALLRGTESPLGLKSLPVTWKESSSLISS